MRRRFTPGFAAKTLLRTGAALALAAALSGCSMFDKKEPPAPCPKILIDRDTAKATRFVGNGTDLTDMLVETEIQSYTGECVVDKDDQVVKMSLNVVFQATVGPAAKPLPDGTRNAKFAYFVALPDFFPHPAGKQVFQTEVSFPPNVNTVRYRDAEVTLTIPFSKTVGSGDLRVYVGMQLDPKQLEFNRKNQPQF